LLQGMGVARKPVLEHAHTEAPHPEKRKKKKTTPQKKPRAIDR